MKLRGRSAVKLELLPNSRVILTPDSAGERILGPNHFAEGVLDNLPVRPLSGTRVTEIGNSSRARSAARCWR